MNWFCLRGTQGSRPFPGRSAKIPVVLAAITVLLGIGCNRKNTPPSALTVAFAATSQPARVGAVTVVFTLADAASRPVIGAHLTTEADMTHAGMSPVFDSVRENRPGRYESTLKLGMAGDWVIFLHGTLPTGEKLERQFELRDVRPN
jgi:YtkA-like